MRERLAIDRLPHVRKIAVLRANAMGDLMFSLPAFDALRRTYGDAEIVLLGRAFHAEFVRGRPAAIDRVVVLPPIYGVSVPGTRENEGLDAEPAFYDAMRAERFDLALQLHGGGKSSNPFIARLGARVTAGMRAPDAAPLDRWIRYIYYQNEILRYLEVVALVGATTAAIEPVVAVTAGDLRASRTVLPGDDRYVVLHPGATDERRRWPVERFAALGDALASDGLRVVLTGDASERDLLAQVAATMRARAIDVAGRLSFSALVGTLARAELVVGNDTGPLHLARAVGTPSVTAYWVGNAINGPPHTRHHHRALISFTILCPVCKVDQTVARCPHQVSFIAGVSTTVAIDEARDVLAHRRPRRIEQTSESSASQA